MSKTYRKMRVYTKSARQWQAEKARRRAIIAYSNEGLTQTQIAEKLGVSAKTVERDIKKLRPYLERLNWEQHQRINEILQKSVDRIPFNLKFKIIGAAMGADKRRQGRFVDAMMRGDIRRLRRMSRKNARK